LSGIGCFLVVLAAFFALVGLIPFLGWLNWLTTLPLAILATIFGLLSLTREERSTTAALTLIGGVLILFWAIFRLTLGGGII